MFTNSPQRLMVKNCCFLKAICFLKTNDILHLKIAHSVIILQSNKQNMWKWPILPLGLKGLNSAVKRTRVLEYLHRKSISCALIQETHLKQSDVAHFQKYYKLAAFSCALNKTKGVLILVNRKFNLTIEHLGSDEEGRFVFIWCKIYNNRLALVSIYGPNETDSAF